MLPTSADTLDVFVSHPATVDHVLRAIEYNLNSSCFHRSPTGIHRATLGQHAELHVSTHHQDLVATPDRHLRAHYPIRVGIDNARVRYDEFEHEATARRVFAVLRAQGWPVLLTRHLDHVLAHAPAPRRKPPPPDR